MITLEKIIGAALKDRTILDLLGEALSNDLVVAHPFYRQIAEFANDFSLQYRKIPLAGDWALWISSLPERTRDGVRESLGVVLNQDTSDISPDYFGGRVLEELRQVASRTALARINAAQEVTPELFQTLAEKIQGVESGTIQGLANLRDIDLWSHSPREDDLIPTGIQGLDKAIGGWGRELTIIFADSGVGKSILLQNLTAHAAQKGKHSLHITLELGLRPQIHRYYRALSQLSRGEFVSDPKEAKEKLRHWFRFATGSVHLLELPAYSLDPDQLKRIVDRVLRLTGDLHILTLDYLDLMVMPRGAGGRSDYADLGKLTHMVRSLCSGFNLSVLTASQAVRRTENKNRLTMRDMGDSYGKVRGVDNLLGLWQTPEEEEVHQGRIGVLKVRDYGGRGSEIPVYINRDLSIISDLDHPNTLLLMDRLGHRPSPSPSPSPQGPSLLR